jgi:hypothetical protein
MAQLDSALVAAPFGEINVFAEPAGTRVIATIPMKPAVENAQTGLAIDGSNSMKQMFGTHVPPLFRDPNANVVQRIGRQMGKYLAEFDSDGHTTVIYWACGTGGTDTEYLGDFNAAQVSAYAFDEPKRMGTGTKLLPAVRYFAEERFRDAPWGIYVFLTDGVLEDLEEVKAYSLQIAQELSQGSRDFIKFVLIGLGMHIDEDQMIELDDLDYGGLALPNGDAIDLWDHTTAAEMRSFDDIFKEVVSENTIIAPSASIVDSNGLPVKPLRRESYADGLPALVEFIMSRGATAFTVSLPGGQSFTQSTQERGSGGSGGINLSRKS